MGELLRPLLLVALVLAIPLVPFALFGASLEEQTLAWLDASLSPARTVALVVGILAVDVFLPVPSSVINTLAGARLGITAATLAAWLGMTLGGVVAFALARLFGQRFVARMGAGDAPQRFDALAQRYGQFLVVATRALPVLAEASVLLTGAMRLSWRAFLPALALSNLGIALAYSAIGAWANEADALPAAVVASIAIPLAATTIARWWLRRAPTIEPPRTN